METNTSGIVKKSTRDNISNQSTSLSLAARNYKLNSHRIFLRIIATAFPNENIASHLNTEVAFDWNNRLKKQPGMNV